MSMSTTASTLSFPSQEAIPPPRRFLQAISCTLIRVLLTLAALAGWCYGCNWAFGTLFLDLAGGSWGWIGVVFSGLLLVGLVFILILRLIWRRWRWDDCLLACSCRDRFFLLVDASCREICHVAFRVVLALVLWLIVVGLLFLLHAWILENPSNRSAITPAPPTTISLQLFESKVVLPVGIPSLVFCCVYLFYHCALVRPPNGSRYYSNEDEPFFFFSDTPSEPFPLTIGLLSGLHHRRTDESSDLLEGHYRDVENL
jgi:hypothetical protein